MHPIVRETLKQQALCPKCGVDWLELKKSLGEHIASINYSLALLIIFNCNVCSERFKEGK